jgi:hypothetical protein
MAFPVRARFARRIPTRQPRLRFRNSFGLAKTLRRPPRRWHAAALRRFARRLSRVMEGKRRQRHLQQGRLGDIARRSRGEDVASVSNERAGGPGGNDSRHRRGAGRGNLSRLPADAGAARSGRRDQGGCRHHRFQDRSYTLVGRSSREFGDAARALQRAGKIVRRRQTHSPAIRRLDQNQGAERHDPPGLLRCPANGPHPANRRARLERHSVRAVLSLCRGSRYVSQPPRFHSNSSRWAFAAPHNCLL